MYVSWEYGVEELTQQALLAAEEGRWDDVERCYRRRVELFRSNEIPQLLRCRLHAFDSRVYEKLRVATIAARCLLSEVSSKQRILDQFASKMDGSAIARRVSRRM